MHEGGHNVTFVVFLPKMQYLNLIMREQLDEPKLRDILKNNWANFFKSVKVIQDQLHDWQNPVQIKMWGSFFQSD